MGRAGFGDDKELKVRHVNTEVPVGCQAEDRVAAGDEVQGKGLG